MYDVLLGRKSPPIDLGVATMMEVANAYFARASEIAGSIQEGESSGAVPKGSAYSKFRTGELRHFLEVASKTNELGGRRITVYVKKLEMGEG